ncbi:uncharacterized protein LOC134822693 [Bolinopsis microptera]|uniref:uncharacterized protein LOC134822693 n=1 Tax=Bolinopsis microptera TaxID=2820187 RepID=UPI00307AF628
MLLILLLTCLGGVQAFNFCVYKGVTHPLNKVFADRCNRCMCREWGVDTAVCTNIKCNKLVLNAPGCKYNCVQLYNSVHKLLTKTRNLDTIADEVLPLIGGQALKFIRESENSDPSSTEVEEQEVDVNQEDVQPILNEVHPSGDVQQEVQQDVQQDVQQVEEENSTPKRRGRVQGGGRKGKKVLKQQLDKFMLAGKRKRRAKFVL